MLQVLKFINFHNTRLTPVALCHTTIHGIKKNDEKHRIGNTARPHWQHLMAIMPWIL